MYIIVGNNGEGSLEDRVRQVVARRYRERRRLPDYLLAWDVVDRPPARVDGFLVMGSRLVRPGELCLVLGDRRPSVRFERR